MLSLSYNLIHSTIIEKEKDLEKRSKKMRSLTIRTIVFVVFEILSYAALIGVAVYSKVHNQSLLSSNSKLANKIGFGMTIGSIVSYGLAGAIWFQIEREG